MNFISIILCFFFVVPTIAKESITVFPLKNNTQKQVLNWIGYSFPETMFHTLSEIPDIQIWDPLFIFANDSSGWQLESDSLLHNHQKRWKWNYAFGGSYSVVNDTIRVTLTRMQYSKNTFIKTQTTCQGDAQSILFQCADYVTSFLKELSVHVPKKKLPNRKDYDLKGLTTLATYLTGYGYEMMGKKNYAISAYSHAIAMNESFVPPLYRIGRLYNECRNKKEAEYYLNKAFSKSPHSSVIAAAMAEYLIYNNEPAKALSFIDSKQDLLTKTSQGMKAIGMAYMYTGEYQRAVSTLTRALASGQSDLEIEFMLGRAFLFSGQYMTASEIFGRLITYRPQYIRYYSYLGLAYREGGKLQESCNVLENAMNIDPQNVPNLINVSSTYFKLGWYEKAEQYLLIAKRLNPYIDEIYINLGVLYWHMGKKEEAKKLFIHSIQTHSTVHSGLSNNANILFISGNIKKAIKAYKKADKEGKKSEITLFNLAVAYRSLGKLKKAMVYFDEVLLLSPDRLDVLIIQAHLSLQQELYEKAELYYRKILDLAPGHRIAMEKLIILLTNQNRLNEAMVIVENYLNDFPQDREYKFLLLDLYRKIGWYEVALAEYLKLVVDKEYMNDPRAFLGLGKCQFDIIVNKSGSNYDQTIFNLKKAIQLDPKNPEADIIIGRLYKDYKNYPQLAIDHWESAFQKTHDPNKKEKIKILIHEVRGE